MRRRSDGGEPAAATDGRRLGRGVPRMDGRPGHGGQHPHLDRVRLPARHRTAGRRDGAGRGDPRSAQAHPLFLRHLARRALDSRPPTGFFRDLVVEAKGEHAGTLDVKHRGITLVDEPGPGVVRSQPASPRSARSVGCAPPTRRRRGSIDETAPGLEEAFRILWQVRLEHQVRMARAGDAPDDFVDPRRSGHSRVAGSRRRSGDHPGAEDPRGRPRRPVR